MFTILLANFISDSLKDMILSLPQYDFIPKFLHLLLGLGAGIQGIEVCYFD